MWLVWDKQSDINGVSAEQHFERHKYHKNEETIFLKTVDGRVTQVEGKNILASVYGIDATLGDEEFIAEYERVIAEPIEDEATEGDYIAALAELGVTDEENNA